jgi:hypothetical protein
MDLTSNGVVIGEVKLLDIGIPDALPVVILVITAEDVRGQIFEQMKNKGEVELI